MENVRDVIAQKHEYADWAQVEMTDKESWEKDQIKVMILEDCVDETLKRNDELLKALNMLLNSEYSSGCPMCDSGKLRNPEKQHWDDCNWNNARMIYERAVGKNV